MCVCVCVCKIVLSLEWRGERKDSYISSGNYQEMKRKLVRPCLKILIYLKTTKGKQREKEKKTFWFLSSFNLQTQRFGVKILIS